MNGHRICFLRKNKTLFACLYPLTKIKLFSFILKTIISCSWIFGIILGLPQFIVKKFDKKLNWCVYTWCEERMGNAYTTAWFLFTSFLPVTWMIVLYSRVVYTLWVNGKSQKGLQQVRTCYAFKKTPSTRIRIFLKKKIFLSAFTRSVFESFSPTVHENAKTIEIQ